MNSVEAYLDQLNPEQLAIAQKLRHLILKAAPNIEEKFVYKVPFYYYHSRICYLNAFPKGLYIGFVRGQELSNSQGLLDSTDRKEVSLIRFQSASEIPEDALQEIIQEALMLDEIQWEARKLKT